MPSLGLNCHRAIPSPFRNTYARHRGGIARSHTYIMKTDIISAEVLAFAALLEQCAHIIKSQAGRNASGSQVIDKRTGLPASDRFVKMTEYGGAADKTPKAVRDARSTVQAWSIIAPSLPEYAAEVEAARVKVRDELKAKAASRNAPKAGETVAPAAAAKAA